MKEASSTKRLLSDLEAAPALGISVQTLRNWRCSGRGVPYVRIGTRAIRYDIRDIESFIAEGKVEPER